MNSPSPSPVLRELKALARLAIPVAGAQVASMLMWFVDLLMVGRVSVEALDAVSLGRTWIWTTMVVAMGLVFGMDPIASQGHGAKDRRTVGLALQWGLVVGLAASIPVAILWLFTEPALNLAGQVPHLSAQAARYTLVQIPGLPFFLVFVAVRQWLQARGIMGPAMWVSFLANLVNGFVNWILIFGNWGFPALGSVGAGIATMLTQVFMAVALVFWVYRFRLQRGGWDGWSRRAWSPRDLWVVVAYGWPVALQIGFEFWAFAISTLIAGRLGEVQLASHTIAISLASIAFMAPLGVSVAAVTRVGNLLGAGDSVRARRASWVALGLGGGVMLASATIFVVGRHALPRLYGATPAVLALCAVVMPIAAAFQVFDGLQVVGSGILRGMGQTRPAAVFNLIAYYVLALPLAWWLAFHRNAGLAGVWWALCFGLATVAAMLVAWIYWKGPGTGASPALPPRRRRSVAAVAPAGGTPAGNGSPGAAPVGENAL